MSTSVTRVVSTAAFLAVLLSSGCIMASKPAAPAGKSAFFNSCSDVDALVSRVAAGGDCVPEAKTPSSSEGVHISRQHHVSGLRCQIRCGPEAAEKLLRSLKAEVEKLAKQTGAEIIDTTERTGVAEFGGKLVAFEINYGQGNAHGKVEAEIRPARASPDKPDTKVQELKVQVEEWAG
jgi:hypothetical protein